MKIKIETPSNQIKVKYDNSKTIKIQINSTVISNRINFLFDEFYNQITLYTKTSIYSDFIKFNKCKELLFNELKSFVLYYPDIFQTICLNYKHKYNYSCKDFN